MRVPPLITDNCPHLKNSYLNLNVHACTKGHANVSKSTHAHFYILRSKRVTLLWNQFVMV